MRNDEDEDYDSSLGDKAMVRLRGTKQDIQKSKDLMAEKKWREVRELEVKNDEKES